MKIAYCLIDGVPQLNNATARNVRALQWLSERHDVTLLPVYRDHRAYAAAADAAGHLAESISHKVALGAAMVQPETLSWTHRVYDITTARALRPEFLAATDGFDWVWFCYPPIVADPVILSTLRKRGTRVSWDWDCLSLLNSRAVRHGGLTLAAAASAVRAVASVHYEHRYLRKLDVLTVPAMADAKWLRRTTGREVHFLRAAVNVSDFAAARSADAHAPIALFVGSAWGPNIHGIRWLLRNVWSQVADRVPAARLRIVGRGMTSELLGQVPRTVEIVGEVPDVCAELARARVVLSPIFYGAGIPTKLLEAGASGKATVTTTYCDRALGGSGFVVSDKPRSWQRSLVALLTDGALAHRLGERGYCAIERNWSVDAWKNDMAQVEAAVCYPTRL